ncbi:MAG: hypothetical protein GY754_05915 [bacterium]|nr:hypothetical protein [bacterium]
MKKSYIIARLFLLTIGICLTNNIVFSEDSIAAVASNETIWPADRIKDYPKSAADKEISAKPEKAETGHSRFRNYKNEGNLRQYEADKKVIYYYQKRIGYTIVKKKFLAVLHK